MKNHQRLLEIPSAWKGLEHVADWIVETVRPHVIVDLGVDHGFSSCALAMAGLGTVFAVDENSDTMARASCNAKELVLPNIEFVCANFHALAAVWKLPVDILHIDGNHDYENVAKDAASWLPHLRQGGVLMMHDINSFPEGPGKVFDSLDWPKWTLNNYCGLGVATKPYAR